MRVLVIADPVIQVPPEKYGGAERIIAGLCASLQKRGHRVDLMAALGSKSYGGDLIIHCQSSASFFSRAMRKLWFQYLSYRAIRDVDVIINFGRLDYLKWVLRGSKPLVCCFQNPVTQVEMDWLESRRHQNLTLIGLSEAQIEGLTQVHTFSVVPNAADTTFFQYQDTSSCEEYLAFLGRLTENKGVDTAIRVASRCGMKLKIAGNISDEPGGREYFESAIRPYLGKKVEYIGPVDDVQKNLFLGGARALLFPIRWPEPFGIVMVESLACGTPVIATRCASTPEVIEHGKNGFLGDNEDELVTAVHNIDKLKRADCRQSAETKFSVEVMAEQYLQVIHRLLSIEATRN